MVAVYGVGGIVNVPAGALSGNRPPAASFRPSTLGQNYFDTSTTPPTEYVWNGSTWTTAGANPATTTTLGTVFLATASEVLNGGAASDSYVASANDVAAAIAGLVIGAVPAATETTAGIAEIATQVETDNGILDDKIVTPLKLANFVGSGGFPGSFTDLTATGAVTFTGATGALSMTSTTASSLGVTGALVDLTLSSAGGRVIVNGEEAAANAITLVSAAGGLDVDVALQMNLTSSQNAVDAIRILASAGGIDIDAVGAATEDISITNTGGSIRLSATESVTDAINIEATLGGINILASGASAGEDINITATGSSVNISATENNAGAIIVQANGGASERITLLSSQGTGVDSINLVSTAGGITLSGALATADAINLTASAGGVDIDGALQVNIASSQNAIDAIRIVASAGGIDIDAVGAATEDINITNTGGSVVIVATEADAGAITLTATTALGGIDVNAGTGGMTIDSGGVLSLDSAGATNLTATGAFDITIQSTAGSILLNAGEAVTDAINIDSTGGFDLNAALEINIDSSEAAVADAVRIVASAADGGMDIDAGTGGITIDSTGAISIDSQAASNFTVTGAFDLTLSSTAGSINISGGEAAADAINIDAATGGLDVDVALQMNLDSSQAAATAVRINASNAAGGIDVDAGTGGIAIDTTGVLSLDSAATSNYTVTGASADLNLNSAGGSVNITATESISSAIVINASGAAGGVTIDAGTSGVTLGSGIRFPVTSAATAGGTYDILNTDYLITTDSTGGAFQVNLPATPVTGMQFVVYDGTGQAAIGGNITISGNGNNIAAGGTSAATKLINTAYESYILTWNGTLWLGQNIV